MGRVVVGQRKAQGGGGGVTLTTCSPGGWANIGVGGDGGGGGGKAVQGGEGVGQSPQLVLLSWQLAASIAFSPFTNIHQAAVLRGGGGGL